MPQIEPINELIDRLWNEKQVSVVSNGRNCSATLSCENSIFDVSLIDQEASRAIGFIMVYRSRDNYKIENPTWGEERHPGCEEKNFVGLEVTEYYRNQGFGPLLIDIGIGIAQKDFKEKGYTPPFVIRANGINRKLAERFYKPLGFEILENPLAARYNNPDIVPSQLMGNHQ
ncbi:TPA: hypothetical protein HA295_02775 [Candidatus Woesearchaeota archaeon]|nr:hypothetical protein [Candidatus Woesearchaeota archaeon]